VVPTDCGESCLPLREFVDEYRSVLQDFAGSDKANADRAAKLLSWHPDGDTPDEVLDQ